MQAMLTMLVVFSQTGQPAQIPTATLKNSAGQTISLTSHTISYPTRRLGWLATGQGNTPEARLGPVALDFREPNSTTYAIGVVTLIPVSSISEIQFDTTKKTVTLGVKHLPDPLTGSIAARNLNAITVDSNVDGKIKKFAGGIFKPDYMSAVFPNAKAMERKSSDGPVWSVDLYHGEKTPIDIRNPKWLWEQVGMASQLRDTVGTKDKPLLNWNELAELSVMAVDATRNIMVVELPGSKTMKVDTEYLEGGRVPWRLTAMVGEVPAGWKLFPLHTIQSIKKKP